MVNIWEFANTHPRVSLVDQSGKRYVGQTLMVFDAEESDDERDSIAIEMDSGEIIMFYPEEISAIETVK